METLYQSTLFSISVRKVNFKHIWEHIQILQSRDLLVMPRNHSEINPPTSARAVEKRRYPSRREQDTSPYARIASQLVLFYPLSQFQRYSTQIDVIVTSQFANVYAFLSTPFHVT